MWARENVEGQPAAGVGHNRHSRGNIEGRHSYRGGRNRVCPGKREEILLKSERISTITIVGIVHRAETTIRVSSGVMAAFIIRPPDGRNEPLQPDAALQTLDRVIKKTEETRRREFSEIRAGDSYRRQCDLSAKTKRRT